MNTRSALKHNDFHYLRSANPIIYIEIPGVDQTNINRSTNHCRLEHSITRPEHLSRLRGRITKSNKQTNRRWDAEVVITEETRSPGGKPGAGCAKGPRTELKSPWAKGRSKNPSNKLNSRVCQRPWQQLNWIEVSVCLRPEQPTSPRHTEANNNKTTLYGGNQCNEQKQECNPQQPIKWQSSSCSTAELQECVGLKFLYVNRQFPKPNLLPVCLYFICMELGSYQFVIFIWNYFIFTFSMKSLIILEYTILVLKELTFRIKLS